MAAEEQERLAKERRQKLLEDIVLIGDHFFIDPETRKVGAKTVEHWNTTLLALSYVLDQNALIVGEPGFAKTTVTKVLGLMTGYPFDLYEAAMIHGHPDQTFETMVARPDFAKLSEEERVIWLAPAYLPLRIVNEINRLPPGNQDQILEPLETGRFSYLNATFYTGKTPFMATANHPDDGNHILIAPIRDRFGIHLEVGYIGATYADDITRAEGNIEELKDDVLTTTIIDIINDKTKDVKEKLGLIEEAKAKYVGRIQGDDIGAHILVGEEKEGIQKDIRAIPLSTEAKIFRQMIDAELNWTPTYGRKRSNDPVDTSNHGKALGSYNVENATSPRAMARGLTMYAQGLAYLLADKEVTKDHIMAMVPHALGHRLEFTRDFRAQHETTQRTGLYGATIEMHLATELVKGVEGNYATVKADLDLLITAYKLERGAEDIEPLSEENQQRVDDMRAQPDKVDHPLLKEYIHRLSIG
jgi:MoxR-like ATPase